VIVDDEGSNHIKKLPQRFKEAGIPFLKTMPVAFGSLANSNYRDHRKIAIIDGTVGFIGGIIWMNVIGTMVNMPFNWRDTSLRIEGPAVNLLQVQFFLKLVFRGW